jgi:polar amino acid transport system substrate-binding protein
MNLVTSRLILGLFAFLLTACAASQPTVREVPLPPLRVGVTPDAAPYVFQREDGFAGIEIDFARRLASALGRDLELVAVPWDEQIPALLSGRTDVIMSGMSITPTRASRVAFGQPYLTTALSAVVRREDSERWPTPEALLRTSPRIGVKAGTTGEALVRQRRGDEQIVVYRRSRDAINELRGYRIDVYVTDTPVIEAAVVKYPTALVAYPREVGKQSIAWAFRPEDENLRRDADDVLARWRADGTVRAVLDTWPSTATE